MEKERIKLRPVGERIVLKPIKIEEKTKLGIYLPKSENNKKEGIVEAVGSFEGKNISLKKGDHVIYGGYSNEEFEIDKEKFLIIDYKDIIAVLEEEKWANR